MNIKNESGQLLVEALIALGLFVVVMSAVIIFFFNGQFSAVNSGKIREALGVARNGVEAARFIRDGSWDDLTDGEHGLVFTGTQWQFSGTSDVTGEFTRKITISVVEDNVKKILSQVTWQDERLGQQQVSLVTYLSDWKNAPPPGGDPGDTGGGGPTGDWTNPHILGSLDLGPGNQATDVDVLNKIVFLSAKASAESKPDFYVIDATDGENPFIVSSLNTGSGLNSLDASGDFVYGVHNDKNVSHLQVINVSDINNPSLVSSFFFTDAEEAISIFYLDNKVYIGTETSGVSEFYVVDVSTPTTPVLLGGLEIGFDVRSVLVKNNKAYIAANSSVSELMIIDVTDPANMSISHTFDIPAANNGGRSVYSVGQKLFLGLDKGSYDEFQIINIADLGDIQTIGSADMGADLNDIRTRDTLAFLATDSPNNEFQVWDITDPANPILNSAFNFPQSATGIDYEDNMVYVSVRSNDGLRIITSTP